MRNVPSAACSASGCTALCAKNSENGFVALALQKVDRQPVHDVGDVAAVLHVLAVVIQPRVVQLSMPVVADPRVVTGPRHAVIAHVPLADVRGLVAEPLQLEVVVRQADGSSHRARRCR